MTEEAQSLSESIRLIYRTRRYFGLRRRSIVAISGLVALVLLAQGLVMVTFGQGYLAADSRERSRSFAKLASSPICKAYVTYHNSGATKLRDLVRETVELNRDLLMLEVFDTEGRKLYAFDRKSGERSLDEDGFPLDDRLLYAVKGLDQIAWIGDGAPDEEIAFTVVQPYVEDWGRHRLTVVFGFGGRFVDRAVTKLSKWLGILALLALTLAFVCAYALAGQSLRPLERLIYGARILSEGDLSRRIDLESGDEFEVLGATLNHMAELLAGTIRDLESSNRRLGRVNAELQELDKVKSDLLANVSHELRTPLTAISGYTEAMAAGLLGDVSPVQKDSLAVVDRNIVRLRGMIDQLLSYSRLDSGPMELDMHPFDLGSVARHVGEAVKAAHRNELMLDIQIDDAIPEAFGDASKITQVLENLLTNAAKFSGPEELVELKVRGVDAGLLVEVVDHGIGISEQHLSRIFDRFYQVDATARRQFGGIGLGLAIVKEILDMHHSEISVQSTPGHGTTFGFILARSVERTGLVPIQGGNRLLLVDDDGPTVQRITSYLVAEGWTVWTAATGEQGAFLARRERPDVILLDRLLPDMDGFDLVTRLSEDEKTRRVPVVLFTVRPERALGLRLGVADYWIKPLEPEAVKNRLEQFMKNRSQS